MCRSSKPRRRSTSAPSGTLCFSREAARKGGEVEKIPGGWHPKRAKAKEPKKESHYLFPDRSEIKSYDYAVLDLESKDKDSQKAGFDRPFLADFYDGTTHYTFRNDARHVGRSYKEIFWIEPGGCIDLMMKHIFGIKECAACEIGPDDVKFGKCDECVARRKLYQDKRWRIGSHNGGNFDNLFVLGWIRKHQHLFGYTVIPVQGRILKLSIRLRGLVEKKTKGEGWTLIDTYALLPNKLEAIGQAFCKDIPEAQKIKFDLHKHEDDPAWEEYNQRDCVVLLTALYRFRALVEHLGGSVGLTAASTAMNLFRRKYQKKPIVRNAHFPECDGHCHNPDCLIDECRLCPDPERRKCHGCLHDFIRGGFFGGRTEIFQMRASRVLYFDVNSSYPTSMLEPMPVGEAMHKPAGLPLSSIRALGSVFIGFIECVIHVPENTYLPALPYRWTNPESKDQKLIFPVGTMYGVWDWVEIEQAIKMGAKLIDVGRSVWFKRERVFVKMIRDLYAYRQKACRVCGLDVKKGLCQCEEKTWDPAMDELAKLMMNSSFGKFGTNPIREKFLFLTEDDEIPEFAIIPPRRADNQNAPFPIQHFLEEDYIIPQISAHITALSRVLLLKGLQSVLRRKGEIVYSDTDSAVVTLPIEPCGGELGEWKLEKDWFDIDVPLPKMYMLTEHEPGCSEKGCKGCLVKHSKGCKDKMCAGCESPIEVKMKGVPKELQSPRVFAHLKAGKGSLVFDRITKKLTYVDDDGGGEVRFKRLTKFKTMMKLNLFSPEDEDACKSVKSTYDKRLLLTKGPKAGIDTRPRVVNDPKTCAAARRAIEKLKEEKLARTRKTAA